MQEKIEERYFEPSLLWAMTKEKLLKEGEHLQVNNDPRIMFFVEEKGGAYFIECGKLYYDEDTNDSYFGNTKEKLSDLKIREIVVKWYHRRQTKTFLNFSQFLQWLKYDDVELKIFKILSSEKEIYETASYIMLNAGGLLECNTTEMLTYELTDSLKLEGAGACGYEIAQLVLAKNLLKLQELKKTIKKK